MLKLATALTVLCAAAPVLHAQEAPDTLPFRAHQWAFLFTGGSAFAGVGAIHFTAPNRAWIINVGGTVSHLHGEVDLVPDTTSTQTGNSINLSVRLGRRFYQTPHRAIASFQSFGILGGWSHSCSSASGPGIVEDGCSTTWSGGFFGEIGAQYFLTSHLSIGGQVGANLQFDDEHGSGTGVIPGRNWIVQLSFGQVGFGGAVYF